MPIYRLRSGVDLSRGRDGRWLLRDRTLRRAMRLGKQDARVLRLIAGGRGRSFAQLVGQLSAKTGDETSVAAELRGRLRALARLYVLAGPRAKLRLALAKEAAAFDAQRRAVAGEGEQAAEAVIFPPGRDPPRHACVATGACCSASFLGPMSEADRVRVSGLTLGGRARVGRGSDALESVVFRDQELWGMRRIGGSCVALGDDGLCDLHAEHGYDIKPIPCRQFPLRFHRTPWGLHVSLLLACEGYDRARGEAGAWADREAEVRAFVAEGAHVPTSALPFEWSAGLPASVAETRTLLDELLAIVADAEAAASPSSAPSPASPASPASPQRPGALDPRQVLADVIDAFERAAVARARALAEGEDLLPQPDEDATEAALTLGLATAGLAAALRGSEPWFDSAGLAAHQANLAERAATLAQRDEPADAERLQRFARGLAALADNRQVAPRGEMTLAPLARRHLLDVIANDLPAQIALGQLDAGLANLARRLRFIEAVACGLCAADGGGELSARHTTLALKLAYRSEPDITALSVAWLARRGAERAAATEERGS